MNAEEAQVERFDLASLPARAWKNGGGLTREIAACPPGAGFEAFGWRLSVAEVERDGPFSAFPGVDRILVLLTGAGLRLQAGPEHAAAVLERAGDRFAFAGEAAVDARLVDGPTRDLNVMTRRGLWGAEVAMLDTAARVAAADALLLMSGAGRWQIDAGESLDLAPGQALLWRAPAGPLPVRPHAAPDRPWLLAVRLCQHRAR